MDLFQPKGMPTVPDAPTWQESKDTRVSLYDKVRLSQPYESYALVFPPVSPIVPAAFQVALVVGIFTSLTVALWAILISLDMLSATKYTWWTLFLQTTFCFFFILAYFWPSFNIMAIMVIFPIYLGVTTSVLLVVLVWMWIDEGSILKVPPVEGHAANAANVGSIEVLNAAVHYIPFMIALAVYGLARQRILATYALHLRMADGSIRWTGWRWTLFRVYTIGGALILALIFGIICDPYEQYHPFTMPMWLLALLVIGGSLLFPWILYNQLIHPPGKPVVWHINRALALEEGPKLGIIVPVLLDQS